MLAASWTRSGVADAPEVWLAPTGGVSLHQLGDGRASGLPFRLVTQDLAIRPEPAELGHRRDDRIVRQPPIPTGVDLARHEVASDGLERRRPSTPAQAIAFSETFEPIVVTDGMTIVLGHVVTEVDPQPGYVQARRPAIVIDGDVADRALGELDIRSMRIAIREAAPAAERRVGAHGR